MKLEFRLTSEVFYRLTESGESLFPNAAIVPEGAPAKITRVDVVLDKTDSPTKSYPLKVIAFGTKERSLTPLAAHHFYSRSPYHYLAGDQVLRPVRHCLLGTYDTVIESQFRDFHRGLVGLHLK